MSEHQLRTSVMLSCPQVLLALPSYPEQFPQKGSEGRTPGVSLPKLKHRLPRVPAGIYKGFRNLLKHNLLYNSFKTNSILQFSYPVGPDQSVTTPCSRLPIKVIGKNV